MSPAFRTTAAALILALILPAGPAPAQESVDDDLREFVAVDEPVVALTGVKVIDGTGAPGVEDRTVLIRDGRIAAVGPAGRVDVPSDARVVDLAGHTVLPGLVGLHNHSYYTGGNGRAAQLSFSGSPASTWPRA